MRIGACLSLTGQYSRFGKQAAHALHAWREIQGAHDIVIEDDQSSSDVIEIALPLVASQCDVLLGPYSTQLARVAGRIAASEGWLLWNQGGSGDDVENAYPGHMLSILTPTSRYAEPYLRYLRDADQRRDLWIVRGRGSFGRQVAAGAASLATILGFASVHVTVADHFNADAVSEGWSLLSAGRFEDDAELVSQVQRYNCPPVNICAVAAGVREFADLVEHPDGIFGIAQWFPGDSRPPTLGPSEAEFLGAYSAITNMTPDYPAVQALAGAVVAEHCVEQAGSTRRDELWSVASTLDTDTLFGNFSVDSTTGAQLKHQMALVRWSSDGLVRVE